MTQQTLPLRRDISRLVEITEKILAAIPGAHYREFTWCSGYAEPGYQDPESGIVFSNWNPAVFGYDKSRAEQKRDPVLKLSRILEKCGCELEWSDEWSTCSDCGKAVRTSGNCHGWLPHYRIIDECEIVCLDCLDPESYLESIEDDPSHACPDGERFSPIKFGYVQFEEFFESGFHPGQHDDPKKILARMQAAGLKHCLFRLSSAGQFDLRFEAYHKIETGE